MIESVFMQSIYSGKNLLKMLLENNTSASESGKPNALSYFGNTSTNKLLLQHIELATAKANKTDDQPKKHIELPKQVIFFHFFCVECRRTVRHVVNSFLTLRPECKTKSERESGKFFTPKTVYF